MTRRGRKLGPSAMSARAKMLEALRALPQVQSASLAEHRRALAAADLARALHHLDRVLKRKKTTKIGAPMSNSDLPSELGSYSDGVTDDAAFHPEIIGCGMPGISGSLQHLSVAGGLGDLALVGAYRGIPGYLLTKKGLRDSTVRLRIAENIRAMTPKLRRRVLHRLRQAVQASRTMARVSGAVRGAYPSIAGNVGWSGITVSGSRGGCPFANVAGALTP